MRCLLTGATGFLGSSLLPHLIQGGCEVTVLLRPSSRVQRIQSFLPQVQVIVSELSGAGDLQEQLMIAQPEVVIHLAWTGGNNARHQNDSAQVEDNLPGALNLIQAASAAGTRRWVGIGSAFEYGNLPGILTESDIPAPNTLYAISKYALCLASAKLCSLLGMEQVWARPFALYGALDDPRGLLPYAAKALLRGECPALTTGEQVWDFLHVEDAARAVACLAAAPHAEGIYNVASGKAQTVRSLVERLRDLIDPALPLGFGEVAYHPDQIMNLRADARKLEDATGWKPQVTLEEGLKRIIVAFSAPSSSASSSSASSSSAPSLQMPLDRRT